MAVYIIVVIGSECFALAGRVFKFSMWLWTISAGGAQEEGG
jgi:hypothetical protein